MKERQESRGPAWSDTRSPQRAAWRSFFQRPALPRGLIRLLVLVAVVTMVLGLTGAREAAPPPPSEDPGATPGATPAPPPRSAPTFLRGMTVSCPTWGPIWGSPAMAESLQELRSLGVEWVAIHPYARISRDGTVGFRPTAELDFLARAVELAREHDIQLFWKPHLAYWGSFEWRGVIEFGDDPAAWRRFFDGYRAFILDQARFAEAHGVPLLALGTELEATTHRPEWRSILRDVRRVYSGRLTWAANWDSLDKVPFWGELDWIGVQAYFPLSTAELPDRQALWRGWDDPLERLGRLAERHGKGVLLTEIGYDRGLHAAREPWRRSRQDSEAARRLRHRLMEVALERLAREDLVVGMFWWKWMPGPRARQRDFSMRTEEARQVLREHWGSDGPRRAR